ncbi:MAG: hypothetical protein U0168_21980 [Nannocystaceae bacterium]
MIGVLGLWAGCTAAPVAGDLELAQGEAPQRAGVIAIPDAARPAAPIEVDVASPDPTQDDAASAVPASARGLLPAADPGPPRRVQRRGQGDCGIEVHAIGLPAVATDGDRFVYLQRRDSAGADFGGPITVELRDRDEGNPESLAVYDESFDENVEHPPRRSCRVRRAEVTARIAAINERLATGFRPLQRVAVQWPWRIDGAPELPEPAASGHERPLEALYHGGHFVARVRGVTVVQSSPSGWRRGDPEQTLDAVEPTVLALYHDAATGLGLAELSYESGSCMSDPNA